MSGLANGEPMTILTLPRYVALFDSSVRLDDEYLELPRGYTWDPGDDYRFAAIAVPIAAKIRTDLTRGWGRMVIEHEILMRWRVSNEIEVLWGVDPVGTATVKIMVNPRAIVRDYRTATLRGWAS